jgi:alanine dehydrogenase
VLQLAGRGLTAAVRRDAALAKGVNVWRGRIVHPAVAHALGERATPLEALLS